jgi:hypothetical protein
VGLWFSSKFQPPPNLPLPKKGEGYQGCNPGNNGAMSPSFGSGAMPSRRASSG